MSDPAARHPAQEPSFLQKAGIVAAMIALTLLLWRLADVVMLVFGATVLAVALRARDVRLRQWLAGRPLGVRVLEWWNELALGAADGVPWARLVSVAGLTLNALGSLLLMVLVAIFLAASPEPYQNGMVRLVPVAHRARVRAALQACGDALRRWLLGQALSMLFVGVSTALTLAVLGVPLAAAVGLLAGLMAFVPFFGAIAAGVLSVLLAFAEGPRTAAERAGCSAGAREEARVRTSTLPDTRRPPRPPQRSWHCRWSIRHRRPDREQRCCRRRLPPAPRARSRCYQWLGRHFRRQWWRCPWPGSSYRWQQHYRRLPGSIHRPP